MKRVLLVFLLGAAACAAESKAEEGAAPKPTSTPSEAAKPTTPKARATWIEAATLEPSTAAIEVTLPGEVEGSRIADLSSQGGQVEAVLVGDGQDVTVKQPLFHVDRSVRQAELAQDMAEKKAAQREYNRAQKLARVISEVERDEASERLEKAKASLRLAEIRAQRAVVRAPFDGVIVDIDVERGEAAAPGATIARLLQLDPIRVTLSVPDRDVVALEQGMPCEVMLDARAKVWPGRVVLINPAADTETRAFKVEVEVDNPERELLPGMIARVRLFRAVAEGKRVIPQSFLVTQREANGVFVVEDGQAKWRPLKLGPVVRDQVVVEEGIELGDNVVVVGQRALADGDAVIISRQGTCCEHGRAVFD